MIDGKADSQKVQDILAQIDAAERLSQIKIAHTVDMAVDLVKNRFGGIEQFKRAGENEKKAYIGSLNGVKQRFSKTNPTSSIGFDLMLAWVKAMMVNDNRLVSTIDQEMKKLAALTKLDD